MYIICCCETTGSLQSGSPYLLSIPRVNFFMILLPHFAYICRSGLAFSPFSTLSLSQTGLNLTFKTVEALQTLQAYKYSLSGEEKGRGKQNSSSPLCV